MTREADLASDSTAEGLMYDAVQLREVLSSVCTPVTIVTSLQGTRAHGTTVSAFSSLSLSPPMVMVALDRASDLLRIIRHSKCFGVNVLGEGQEDLAQSMARKGKDKLAEVEWFEDHGAPRLRLAPGWIACRLVRCVSGGDHLILLGLVIQAEAQLAAPLVYAYRQFGTHSNLSRNSVC